MVIVVSNWRGEYETVFSSFPHIAGGAFLFLPPPHLAHLAHQANRACSTHVARAPTAWWPGAAAVVDVRRFFPCFISTNLETDFRRKHSDCGICAHDP